MNNPKIVVHICCAVCGSFLTGFLKQKFNPVLYYYNPNIHPAREYEKRKKEVIKLAKFYNVPFVEGKYEVKKWFEMIKGLEKEKEGGKRCEVCYRMRLSETAGFAKTQGIKFFTTTLGLSPHKSQKKVDATGEQISKEYGLEFIKTADLGNKNEIWQKTKEKSRSLNLYHQNYCGCVFSKIQRKNRSI